LLQYSPNEISVRKIAELAKIKHPLIYRHFETKDKLIMLILNRGLTAIVDKNLNFDKVEGNVGLFFQVARNNKFRLALARAMVEGINPHQIQDQFPLTQKLLELMQRRESEKKSTSKFGVRFSTAALAALALGWMLYEPFLLAATDLEDESREEIDRKIVELLEDFIEKIC
jgi:TetR/AcrR family transcriptional regulator, repressor for neighboring sulfatase